MLAGGQRDSDRPAAAHTRRGGGAGAGALPSDGTSRSDADEATDQRTGIDVLIADSQSEVEPPGGMPDDRIPGDDVAGCEQPIRQVAVRRPHAVGVTHDEVRVTGDAAAEGDLPGRHRSHRIAR